MEESLENKINDEVHNIMDGLVLTNFFKDFEIEDLSFAEEFIKDFLIKKCDQGFDITNQNDDLFDDDEFDELLQNIIAGSTINQLEDNGLINDNVNFETINGKIIIK